MRRQLYNDLKVRLKRLTIDERGDIIFTTEEHINSMKEAGTEPDFAIKHFGLWNRQVEFIEEESVFPMPAVFIEFGKISWRHQKGGLQDADITIGLHVLTEAFPEGYDSSDFHLDLLGKINKCLHGFNGECFSSIRRTASIPCHDHEQILDNTEVFQTMGYDVSGTSKELVKHPTPPDILIRKG